MTQEFHLSVTPVGNNRYLVRTERVAPGVPLAEEQVTWAVDNWLAQARQLMSDPLQGLLQGDAQFPQSPGPEGKTDAILSRSSLNLVELGQELYTALFQGTLRDSWVIAQGVAQNRREALRLRLGLKGTELPRLPWEVMYGTDVPVERLRQPGSITSAPRPLATGTRLIFSRYQSGTRLVEEGLPVLPQPNQPLRILMVVSAPTDQEQLKLYREVKQMQQELQTQPASRSELGNEPIPEIELKILNQPGREELTRALEQGHFQALHYAGHSDLSAAGGSLYLVNNRTGLTEVLTGDDLAGLLVNNGIRLVVFNSCRGSYTAAADPSTGRDRNLAEALVSRSIPAVLAMAEQIPDNVALYLTGLFYRNLKLGFPIDLSLNRARQGLISAYGSHQFYWALPVLYLHPEFDGYLMAGDRSRDNPADRLSLMPSGYSPPPAAARPEPREPLGLPAEKQPVRGTDETWTPAPPAGSTSGAASRIVAASESLEALEDDARSEETDRLVIAEMLQQLSPPAPKGYPTSPRPNPSAAGASENHSNERPAASISPAQATSTQSPAQSSVQTTPAQTAALTSPSTSARSKSHSRRATGKRQLNRFLLFPVLGAIGGMLAYVGFQNLPQQDWTLPNWFGSSSTPVETPVDPPPPIIIDPAQSTEELRALAIDTFRKQQTDQGIEAVKALLGRGALDEASDALAAVPEEFKEDPRINFLRGRLAWQGMKAADGEHTLEQARTFWENAAKADPETLIYQEALGFTYYAEGNTDSLKKAIESWFESLSLPNREEEALGFEAVIALVLQKAAAEQPPQQREKSLLNAVQLYQKVTSRDAENFKPEALRQNWLWTEAAVKDWETLRQLANKQTAKQNESEQ